MKRLVAIVLLLGMTFSLSGCGLFETMSGKTDDTQYCFSTMEELENGKAYIWKDKPDANGNEFFACVKGDINFKGEELADVAINPRSIWVDETVDEYIPTLTSKDQLLYLSETLVPDEIIFERYGDYGYSIGVSNMIADGGGHYYFPYQAVEDDDYKIYVDLKSDAKEVIQFEAIEKLYLDKVGKIKVDKESVSNGGTVLGLEQGKSYVCEFYTGTYFQDFNLRANIHSFGAMERFVSYEYEFLHSNCIAITIPEYFKSGYYFVNGIGLFRYVTDEDLAKYNGKSYDAGIDWNDPIIIYDENGFVVYDPTDLNTEDVKESSDPGDENFVLEENNSLKKTGEEESKDENN